MSYVKYYDDLFIDEKINNKFVTYLAALHIENVLIKRDRVSNNQIKDLGNSYSQKAEMFYETALNPLGFLKDDIQVIYDYTIEHIDKILENPHQSIVKEKQLVRKEKLKSVDAKTLNWLANKPGSTIKEKLANVNKVSSTVKRYTRNIKENKVLLSFYKDLSRLLYLKIDLIKNNPSIFGENSKEINDLKRKLNKVKFSLKNDFEEVIEKDYTTPNNALIGNVHYASVWNSYLNIKQKKVIYDNAFEMYKESYKEMFISLLMNRYSFIENSLNVSNMNAYVLYNKTKSTFTELIFNDSKIIEFTRKQYSIDKKIELLSTDTFKIEFIENESESDRGIAFSVFINDDDIGVYYADILGFKELFDIIIKKISLNREVIKKNIIEKSSCVFASINSFDNTLYTEKGNLNVTGNYSNNIFENNELYFVNTSNVNLNSIKNDGYGMYLRLLSNYHDYSKKNILVYDIKDNYDEFSSATLRRNFSSTFQKSYPVWRSILAGESIEDKEKIRIVIDFCGQDEKVSISQLERKKGKFIHCGPIETPLYYQTFVEMDFYKAYIKKYEQKYEVKYPIDIIREAVYNGKMNALLSKKIDDIILVSGNALNHELYLISFDNEIFDETLYEFESAFLLISSKYEENSTIYIVPDFLEHLSKNKKNIICNKDLIIGAKIISDRVNNSEITWYEKLPKLSLEIIKDGMFDNLVLVDNQECENIIGKSLTINVPERLTLSKGNKNYILPLNKSFIGEQNDSFVAKAEDPSFPLNEDVDVRLVIEYSFASENSYILKLYPVSKASFECIEIKWEKEENENRLIYPNIKDVIFDDITITEQVKKINYSLETLSRRIANIKDNKYTYLDRFGNKREQMIEAMKDLSILANIHQRLFRANDNIKNMVGNIFANSNILDIINYLIQKTKKDLTKDIDDRKRNILNYRLYELESFLVEFTLDASLFINKELNYPCACYGRYFSDNPTNIEILDMAYAELVKLTTNKNFVENEMFGLYMNKLTSATACRHKVFMEIANVHPTFISYLLKCIIYCFKELSNFDWKIEEDDLEKYRITKENGFLLRYCVELLISFLYCREQVFFCDFQPKGKLAKELTYYLKKLNKNIVKGMEMWTMDMKKKKMLKTKYHIEITKPDNLTKMWTEAYCLILYLSGDERANYIKIGNY